MVVVNRVAISYIYHTDGLVNTRAIDIFAQEIVIAVVFSDNVTTIIEVLGNLVVINRLFNAPATRVICMRLGFISFRGSLYAFYIRSDLLGYRPDIFEALGSIRPV